MDGWMGVGNNWSIYPKVLVSFFLFFFSLCCISFTLYILSGYQASGLKDLTTDSVE